MKRWAIAAVALAVAVAGGAAWVVADLRSDLEDARDDTRLLGFAKAASDEDGARLRRELRRVRNQVQVLERHLREARSQLRDAYDPLEVVEDVADERFCFTPYDGRFSGFVRGPLRADVDGDGAADRVFTVGRPTLLGRACRYFLVAETGTGRYSTRITGGRLWMGSDPGQTFQLYLGPVAAARIDDSGGSEILLQVSQGASSHFGVLYTLTGGGLQRVRVEDEPVDTLHYLGSLCCGGAMDCVGPHFVMSGYGRRGNERGYVVHRTLYRLQGSTLVVVRKERHRPRGLGYGGFDEFDGIPLSGCASYTTMKPPFPSATSSPPVIRRPR